MLNMWFGFGGWAVVMAFYMPLDVKNCACFVVCIYGLGQESLKKRGECRRNRWERNFSMFCGDEQSEMTIRECFVSVFESCFVKNDFFIDIQCNK